MVCLDILLKNSRAKIIENSTVEAEKILNNDVFIQYNVPQIQGIRNNWRAFIDNEQVDI